jgi:hypothetical protein
LGQEDAAMRPQLLLLSLLMFAPAAAAQAPANDGQLPPVLTDPATADKLAGTMQALSKAFLNLPVGEVRAAMDGRQPTPTEKKQTLRDLGRAENRNFDREFQQQMANAGPMILQSMQAMAGALPVISSDCLVSSAVALRSPPDGALRRYLDMEPYQAWQQFKALQQSSKDKPTTIQT